MPKKYDAIVIGAGHNGLILQAYLCRAGLDVVSIDRREVSGGGLVTIENPRHAGFLHDTHAVFHRALDTMPWYRDLELARRGLLVGCVINEYQRSFARGDFLIRNVMGLDEDSGALIVGEKLQEGQIVQFHLRDAHAHGRHHRISLRCDRRRRGRA